MSATLNLGQPMSATLNLGQPYKMELGIKNASFVINGGTGSDKNFTQTFVTASTVVVNHNLGKYPSAAVFDSAGDEVEGTVNNITINQLTLTFSAPFSGTVTCN